MPREKTLTPEPLPEQILKCAGCKGDIIAYGTRGESFITKNVNGLPVHYHNNGKCMFM